jgi:hypothetical protein
MSIQNISNINPLSQSRAVSEFMINPRKESELNTSRDISVIKAKIEDGLQISEAVKQPND